MSVGVKNCFKSVFVLVVGLCLPVSAAEQPSITNRPTREQIREELRPLTPEERQARIREIREKLGPGGPMREEAERRRAEWRDLPPEDRRAKAQEWRANRPGVEARPIGTNTQERALHRQQIRERLEKQIQELTARKAQAPLTAEDQKRLDNLQQVAKYFTTKPPAAPSRK